MINSVGSSQSPYQNNLRYNISQEQLEEIKNSQDHLMPKTPTSQIKMFSDKFFNAATVYPAKGLMGDRNSNFYEFLTMGMVPYTLGSLTLMGLFNSANKFFKPAAAKAASKVGTKMALGVLFYGLAKEVSKKFISVPVHAATGVDIDMPYQKWVNEFATSDSAPSPKSIEYHKVFESVDFPRYDLLYYQKSGKPRNYYYDKVAKKLGRGSNLEASDQEVKSDIRKILIRAKAATSLSSFLWAGVGVAYAMQDSWGELFNRKSAKGVGKHNLKEFAKHCCDLGKKAAVDLWNGTGKNKKINVIAGRAFVIAAALSSVVGAMTTIIAAKQNNTSKQVVDKNKAYMVD